MSAASLDAWWMPFTANAAFKKAPKLIARARGVRLVGEDGRELLDAMSGLWCVNAGHCRPEIAEAIARQAAELDFVTPFGVGHRAAFEAAERLVGFAPPGIDHAFLTNSGSEAVDSALKIVRAVHRARGETRRTVVVGRERGYHGAGFGGISVGGIEGNRAAFAPLLPDTDHLRQPALGERPSFVRGQADGGEALADELLGVIERHGPGRVAAVIVEPVAGSAGVLVPPTGYLERLSALCREHGILLVFDEVITGFGRLGARFAADRFGVVPDVMTVAKGLTNGSVPMGAALVRGEIYQALVSDPERGVELAHGYTYSGHPLACAAALATLEIHEREQLAARAAALAGPFESGIHGLAEHPGVADVRNLGMMGAVELSAEAGPGVRARAVFEACFAAGVLVRLNGDVIALCPPLVCEPEDLARIFQVLAEALDATG